MQIIGHPHLLRVYLSFTFFYVRYFNFSFIFGVFINHLILLSPREEVIDVMIFIIESNQTVLRIFFNVLLLLFVVLSCVYSFYYEISNSLFYCF